MTDYAVTVTAPLTKPLTNDQIETLAELLGDTAIAINDDVSITTSVTAADPIAAGSLASFALTSMADEVGISLEPIVEIHALEWDRHEAELEKSNMPDLVSAPEVGNILGVSRQRVHKMLSDERLPPPILRLGSGPLWLRATIESFDRSWTRRPGRPPASKDHVELVSDLEGASNDFVVITKPKVGTMIVLGEKRMGARSSYRGNA